MGTHKPKSHRVIYGPGVSLLTAINTGRIPGDDVEAVPSSGAAGGKDPAPPGIPTDCAELQRPTGILGPSPGPNNPTLCWEPHPNPPAALEELSEHLSVTSGCRQLLSLSPLLAFFIGSRLFSPVSGRMMLPRALKELFWGKAARGAFPVSHEQVKSSPCCTELCLLQTGIPQECPCPAPGMSLSCPGNVPVLGMSLSWECPCPGNVPAQVMSLPSPEQPQLQVLTPGQCQFCPALVTDCSDRNSSAGFGHALGFLFKPSGAFPLSFSQ